MRQRFNLPDPAAEETQPALPKPAPVMPTTAKGQPPPPPPPLCPPPPTPPREVFPPEAPEDAPDTGGASSSGAAPMWVQQVQSDQRQLMHTMLALMQWMLDTQSASRPADVEPPAAPPAEAEETEKEEEAAEGVTDDEPPVQ